MTSSLAAFAVVFLAFAAITVRAMRANRSTESHYVALRQVPAWQNGLAIIGEFASSASLLGISGAVALSGYGGFYLGIGPPIGFLLLLVLVAVPLRRAGRYTVADVLATAFPSRALRAWSAVTTITVCIFYMMGQFVGGGLLLKSLVGLDYVPAVLLVGAAMALIGVLGGMIAATHIQVVKTIMMLVAVAALLGALLVKVGGNPLELVSRAYHEYGSSAVVPPHSAGPRGQLDTISLVLSIALGLAGLPHIMIRFLTVRDEGAARRSARLACWTMSIYLVVVVLIGFGAAVFVGRPAITQANSAGTLAVVQLARYLLGPIGEGALAGVILAVIIPVLAGLVIASSGAIGQDIYTQVVHRGVVDVRRQLMAARVGALATCAVGVALALWASSVNLAFLGSLAFAVAASTNLPVLILALYWRRFNTTGATAGMIVGFVSSVLAIVLGPNVLGHHAVFPLSNPALVTVPVAFVAALAATVWRWRHGPPEPSTQPATPSASANRPR